MAGPYVKVFGSILNSTVWCLDPSTKLVWITMLLLGDGDGTVWASVPGVARQAGVSIEDAKRALDVLCAPDPESRTPDHDGRRLLPVDGGWQIVNALKYRELQTDGQRKSSIRSKRYRDLKKGVTQRDERDVRDVSRLSRTKEEEEEEEEEKEETKEKTYNGNGKAAAPKRSATERERTRLESDPVLASLADGFSRAQGREGRTLEALRAAKRAREAGYSQAQLELVARVVGVARKEPERFPERGSIRWAVERGKTGAEYLWRPSVLDRLIPEAERWESD